MQFKLAKIFALMALAVISIVPWLAAQEVPAGAKPLPAPPAVAPVAPAAKPTPAVTPPAAVTPVAPAAKPASPAGKPAAETPAKTATPEKKTVQIVSAISTARAERIRTMLRSLQDEAAFSWSSSNKEGIIGAVLRQLRKNREFIIDPTIAEVSAKSLETELLDKIRRMVANRYGVPPMDTWKLESEAQFPLAKKGEKISFSYRMNPSSKETISGRIEAMMDGKVIIRAIPYDLQSFEQNTEEDKQLVLRLNESKTLLARRKYCDDKAVAFEDERNSYQSKLISTMITTQDLVKKSSELNEKNGYILVGSQWLSAEEATKQIYDEENRRLASEKGVWEAAAEETARHRLASLDLLMRAVIIRGEMPLEVKKEGCLTCRHPDAHLPGPCPVADCKCGKCEICLHTPHPGGPCPLADCNCGKCPNCMHAPHLPSPCGESGCKCGKKAVSRVAAPVNLTPASSGMLYVIAGVGVLVIAGGIGIIFYIRFRRGIDERRKKKKDEFTAAMLIHEFWQKAKSDPFHFRYVAYQFPTEIEAHAAFKRLSYVHEREGAVLIPPNVEFGFYEENHRHVVYIGGTGFGYSMWREAISMFPSIPGADYYKVSEAPTVSSDTTAELSTSTQANPQDEAGSAPLTDLFADAAPSPEFREGPPPPPAIDAMDLSLEELMALRERTAEEAAQRNEDGKPPTRK